MSLPPHSPAALYLCNARPLDSALLVGMRDLRCLCLSNCELAAGGLQLQVVSRFTALTSLWYEGEVLPSALTITAAEAGVLTFSSQLAELTLSGMSVKLQPQAYASLFPPGRQLPHLTLLCVKADLLSNPAVVCQAGECCPNLQSLTLTDAMQHINADGQAATVADSLRLAAMSAWRGLQQLGLLNPWPQLPAPVWQVLGTLSQLTSLHIEILEVPARQDVLHLTGCTALQELKVLCYGTGGTCRADLTSKVRLVPPATGWLFVGVASGRVGRQFCASPPATTSASPLSCCCGCPSCCPHRRSQVSLQMCGAACLMSCIFMSCWIMMTEPIASDYTIVSSLWDATARGHEHTVCMGHACGWTTCVTQCTWRYFCDWWES